MGVDFYTCIKCEETFSDCGHYVSCYGKIGEGCVGIWCSDECAEADGYVGEEDTDGGSCKYCRGEDAPDYKLVEFLLKEIGISREDAVKKLNMTKN